MSAQRDTIGNILVGDIGGTNARFGLAHRDAAGHLSIEAFKKWPGNDFNTLTAAIEAYIEACGTQPKHISLAIAGPVKDGSVKLTNRDWEISETHLVEDLGFKAARLFNDFEAMARCVPEMSAEDFTLVHKGEADESAPILVAGPGTGFGVGYLFPVDGRWHVINTEGGHQAYSPHTAEELELMDILSRDHDYVSLELVSSGSGLDPVHRAVCIRHGVPYERTSPAELRVLADQGDPVADEVCRVRADATMSALGDLALAGGTKGGIVMAGGVSERMIDIFMRPQHMARLHNRGPRSDYIKNIPVTLLTNPMAPLIGAAALYEDAVA